MFTRWQQVDDWITDNHFKRWIFYKNDPEKNTDERGNNKVLDSRYWADETIDDKLRLTRKYLEQWGSRAYGLAFQNENSNSGGVQCVVYIEQAQPSEQSAQVQQAPVAGMVGMGIGSPEYEQLKAQIREQVETVLTRQKMCEPSACSLSSSSPRLYPKRKRSRKQPNKRCLPKKRATNSLRLWRDSNK